MSAGIWFVEVLCACGVSLTLKEIEPWQGCVCVCLFLRVCECVCVRSTVIVVCLIFVI